ncbi:acetate--CoA ligase family protein [Ramlibacter sp. WS9]|uniref:acetate--CoA ligase family protein n=1 Tax=Ramlibacter sp. WS9 TaxID=1882741 RepID=UPI001141C730|nr:acetate--CoA ligase family protein [Ramlibacter sp. WS9]ROZ64126.1 ATP-grasp domain-containing protein [Ramlibacter sp. WS9]
MPEMTGAGAGQAVEYRGTPVALAASWQVVQGHAYGLRGYVLLGLVRWPVNTSWKTGAMVPFLHEEGGLSLADAERHLAKGFGIDAFLALLAVLEKSSYSPVTQPGVQMAPAVVRDGSVTFSLALPSCLPNFTLGLAEWLVSSINLGHSNLPPARRRALADTVNPRLIAARDALKAKMQAGGVNTVRIARACADMQLPLQWLPGGFIYVGSGPYGRFFRSTETEWTPALAANLARSKALTASLLRQHGLPAPTHQMVNSEEEAVQAARTLGYPVVVKPEDSDGGQGVHAGLRTEEQVRRCYALAAAVSRKVLVESHIEGQDYRITVENGKIVKAIGRQPGGVLGDGRRSVEEIIRAAVAATTGDRRRTSMISLDEEALGILAERGMTARSVPPAGEFVVLRRRANISTGGISRDVMDQIHPDNARLALRATQALRLDLAGIDLIIPDISVSWMDCKAGICEVNSQPQINTEFAPNVYRDLLARMVPAPGRMRTVLVLHASDALESDAGVAAAAQQLVQRGERVLSTRRDGTWLNDERLAPPGRDAFAAAMAAELEREATAVVAALTTEEVLKQGLPWLHLDQVRVLCGPGPGLVPRLNACLKLLAPHMAGDLLLDAATAELIDPPVLARFTVSVGSHS